MLRLIDTKLPAPWKRHMRSQTPALLVHWAAIYVVIRH